MLSIGTSLIDRPVQQTMVDTELSESYVPPYIGLVSRLRREFRGFLARSRDQAQVKVRQRRRQEPGDH